MPIAILSIRLLPERRFSRFPLVPALEAVPDAAVVLLRADFPLDEAVPPAGERREAGAGFEVLPDAVRFAAFFLEEVVLLELERFADCFDVGMDSLTSLSVQTPGSMLYERVPTISAAALSEVSD